MKILIICGIILGVFTTYFVLGTNKSISLKGGDTVIPTGTDIAKFVLDKVKAIEANKIINSIIGSGKDVTQSNIIEQIKSKAEEIKNKVFDEGLNLIKQPIENKLKDVFCHSN